MAQKKCPCKTKAAKHKKKAAKSGGRVAPVRAPVSTKVHHTKSSAKVTEPNLNRGRIQYKF